ncbi:oxidoreductase [Diaporthe helianthi]|uniref:Oxidoreductase n=1 Tax=Diaporthe helianthi TaxID=158607 RepID=A0A2P5HNX7_DIAHE|nr:oxidoreductase [Diaporthe helianthi]
MNSSADHDSEMVASNSVGGVCCLVLSAILGQQKVLTPGTTAYASALGSYFSVQQESMQPTCIVTPQNAQDVSAAVKELVQLHDQGQSFLFAIRSGGHTSWAGASNIQGGPVIDLRALDAIQLSSDKAQVEVGVGATWGDVYSALDPLGLSVNGGRASTPGVGGLTLGSGVSYTSPRYGFTCDTVAEFQVVLADGSIVEANASNNQDLFWALKGGVNNFGIVTRVTLETFQQGPVWSGTLYSLGLYADDVIRNFVKINSATAYDEYASVITSFAYNAASNMTTVANLLQYTKDVVDDAPPVFEGFMAIPTIFRDTKVASMTAITDVTATQNPAGVRSLTMVTTLVSTETALKAAYAQWEASYPALANVTNVFTLILEPLPPAIYKRHADENALGLGNRTESLVIVELFASWTNGADDVLVERTLHNLLGAINKAAKELGALDPYIFANYAYKDQDVMGSYGAASLRKLNQVRDKVDPKRIFTQLVPGGYKIVG